MDETKPRGDDGVEVIELGEWSGLERDSGPTEGAPRRDEDTRAVLAFCLFGLLAAVMGLLILLLCLEKVPADSFAEVAGIMVSPLVGLVGAVTGYYYGKVDR